jgi:hypothetical protein
MGGNTAKFRELISMKLSTKVIGKPMAGLGENSRVVII